ncbi:MAG: hypothetical protein RQ722_08260, partial [Desulfuromonadales bacterium]|nr:hypothetical protein [Desulfuromonadales bacterium]
MFESLFQNKMSQKRHESILLAREVDDSLAQKGINIYPVDCGLTLILCNFSAHKREHVVCSHCLRPTLSLNFPQATAAAHM